MKEHPESFTIKAWPESDRPREKMIQKGKHSLSEAELIAVLIGSGSPEYSAVEVSRQILSAVSNDLTELGKLTYSELIAFRGIGEAKAVSIIAALELGRRRREAEGLKKEKILCKNDVVGIFQPLLEDLKYEEFWILLLNRSNKVICKQKISMGGIAGTVVDVKVIFKVALDAMASGIILCHNHPSGNEKPSDADLSLTRKIKEAAFFLDINLLDHVIIAGNNNFSFADNGIM